MNLPTVKLYGVDFDKISFHHIKERIETEMKGEKDLAVQITPSEADNVHMLYEMAFHKFLNEHPDKVAEKMASNIREFKELSDLEGQDYAREKFELEAFDSYIDDLTAKENGSNRMRLLMGMLHLAVKHDRRLLALEPETKGLPGSFLLTKEGKVCGMSLEEGAYGKNVLELRKNHIMGKLHNISADPLTKNRLAVLLDHKVAVEIAEELKQLGWFSIED